VAISGSIPLSFYEEYWEDLRGWSKPVQLRLHTFLELVGFDPDDAGLLAACQVRRIRLHRVYVYPLAEGYAVYWRTLRSKPLLLTLRPARPTEVQILAISRP
jgi:hypothetical protein